MFDRIVVVDWSAANMPRLGPDSIWIRSIGPCAEHDSWCNLAMRVTAESFLHAHLGAALERGERVLAGFDFPLGFPAGTAADLGLSGAPWRATWDLIGASLVDGPFNVNNRFELAAGLNARMSERRFWGCPPQRAGEHLAPTKAGTSYANVAEWRETERRLKGVQPVWKLYTTGSVGSQTLTGIPVVASVRDALGRRGAVWPFEPVPDGPCVVFAEVWPSQHEPEGPSGMVKDQAQVDDCARRLSALTALPDVPEQARTEEGWVLTA